MDKSGNLHHYARDAEEYDYLPALETELGQSELRRCELLIRLAESEGMNKASRVADLGMGGGQLMQLLAQRNIAATGFDIALRNCVRVRSERFAHNASQPTPPVAAADIFRLPLNSEALDTVFISEVLEHLENPAAALAEARRVLRPGGIAIISCPWCEQLIYHLCVHCNQPTPANAHLHSVTEKNLDGWIRDAGLQSGRKEYFNYRLSQALNLSRRSAILPHAIWRTADTTLGALWHRPLHFAVVARRAAQ